MAPFWGPFWSLGASFRIFLAVKWPPVRTCRDFAGLMVLNGGACTSAVPVRTILEILSFAPPPCLLLVACWPEMGAHPRTLNMPCKPSRESSQGTVSSTPRVAPVPQVLLAYPRIRSRLHCQARPSWRGSKTSAGDGSKAGTHTCGPS